MKLRYLLPAAALLLIGCENGEDTAGEDGVNARESDGKTVFYGGTLNVCESETFSSLFPLEVVDVTSFKVVTQIHDGLLEYDPSDYSLRPAVAENWEVNPENTEFTFQLRKDVTFHDDECFTGGKGRSINAQDIKYTFELLCSKDYELNYNSIVKPYLKGAEEFFNGSAESITGVEIIDDYTVKFVLNEPSTSFIYTLAMPNTSVIAKEAYEKYGKNMTVGCGPFVYTKPKDLTKEIFLVYNPKYYQKDESGNAYPYLDSIHFEFIPSKLTQLEKFNADEISIIEGLPSNKIAQVVSENIENFKNTPPKTILDRQADFSTQYYGFSCKTEPFNNPLVRKAFNYAIDRASIVNNILNGQGTPGVHGITPKIPSFKSYDFSRIKGYSYDPELARQLLAEAGYPNGKDFPEVTLEVNMGGSAHKRVATEVERQINQTLGITISIDQVSFKNKLESAKYSKSEIYRSAWVADYPSPESFLSILVGADVPESMDEPAYPNSTRFVNNQYDSLFNLGKVTVDNIERNNYFAEAEKIMMEEAPIMVLWYTENYKMYHSRVRGFNNNGLAIANFSRVYLKEMTAEEVQAKEKEIKGNK